MNLSTICKVYYSMIGERFNIYERNSDINVWSSKATVQLAIQKMQMAMAGGFEEEEEYDHFTSISIPQEIKGGPFFAADTQCIIVNGRNQILKLGGQYRFNIKMYRNLDDATLFTMLFRDKTINDQPQWVSL